MRVPADKVAFNRGSPVEEYGESGGLSGDTRGGGTSPLAGGGSEGLESTGDDGSVVRKGIPTSTISCNPKLE